MTSVSAGIFVGGASRRMGGAPKGLLAGPDGRTLVARWRDVFAACGVPCVLVGAHAVYAGEGMPMVADVVADAEPLAGLAALLESGSGTALAVACDMPFVSAAHLRALLDAPPAVAVAPKREGRWEPFFARYDVTRARPVVRARLEAGARSLQGLLDALGCVELELGPEGGRFLDDWDTPADIARWPSR
jgi:molybdopterin-guanine dinucleotide biosynthesis protein A